MTPRVLVVIGQLARGGAEKQIYLLGSHFRGGPVAIDIATRRSASDPAYYAKFAALGVPIHNLDDGGGGRASFLLRLRRLLRGSRYQVLQSYLSGDNILCAMARAGVRVRFVSGYRGDYGNPVFTRSPLQRLKDYTAWVSSNRIVSNNRSGLRYLESLPLMNREKIEVIHNGVDLPPLPLPEGPPRIGTWGSLGNLWGYKNHRMLIRAWLSLAGNTGLRIAGEGPARPACEALLQAAGVRGGDVLLGAVDDITAFFAGIDAFVYPSLREGSPNSLLEAMAHGKLCLVSDIPEHREALGQAPEQCFFDPYSAEDLLGKMRHWMSHPEEGRAVAAANRRRIAEEFSVPGCLAAYERLYLSLSGVRT